MKNVISGLALTMAFATPALAADVTLAGVKNRTISYVTSDLRYALYQTADGKQECPAGFTAYGPREQFKDRYPNGGTVAETQLKNEAAVYFPKDRVDNAPYTIVQGKTGLGLNLDGKIGPTDFTSPAGDKGIDNQLYRAVGCSLYFRGPSGNYYIFGSKFVQDANFNRTMIEITNVDDLTNDPEVDVAFYRGLDKLMFDATSSRVMPGGSQRVDDRFGKRYERHFKGKIVDGVLITQPADLYWPWSLAGTTARGLHYQDVRFNLKLTPGEANGFVGGYADVEDWYAHLMAFSTHHQSYGQLYAPALYRTLHELADARPGLDGKNTAISYALEIRMAQVFIIHPEKQVAEGAGPKPAR